MEVSYQLHDPTALSREIFSGTHCCVGLRTVLDAEENRKISFPCRESNFNSSEQSNSIQFFIINVPSQQ
jgi:hypothetical protein